jgi:hypothetical protein
MEVAAELLDEYAADATLRRVLVARDLAPGLAI